MGCYVMFTNPLFLGKNGELSMEKASGSTAKVSSKLFKELEKAKYQVTLCHLPLMFHIIEQLHYFDIFE